MRNVTEDVKKIVKFVQENCEKVGSRYGKTAQQNRLTLNMLVDIFIGETHERPPTGSAGFRYTPITEPSLLFRGKICQGADRNVWDGRSLLQA